MAISLRRAAGNEFSDDYGEEIWAFKQAPVGSYREHSKFPDLYENVSSERLKPLRRLRHEQPKPKNWPLPYKPLTVRYSNPPKRRRGSDP